MNPPPSYNAIAGRSIERLAALSDGIFAVAMTLLVLDLRAPGTGGVRTEADLARSLGAIAPQALMFVMSFLTLGIFWVGQQTHLTHFARGDRHLGWIHLAFLAAVSTMPFSTKLMAEFVTFRLALVLYWLNTLALGVALFAGWRYATRAGLLKDGLHPGLAASVERRIMVAQALYAFGASLCVISTYYSLAFIVVIQLYYALAPRFGGSRVGPEGRESLS